MSSTIIIKNSATSGSAPASLVQGEFGINVTDGKLYYGSGSAGTVKEFNSASYSSYAISSSYALSSSFSSTASYVNPLNQTVIISGSLLTTGSNTFIGITTQTGSLLLKGNSTINSGIALDVEANNINFDFDTLSFSGTTELSGSLLLTGSASITGSVNISGSISASSAYFNNITATSGSITYLTTIYETSSVIYSSGSNQFGDASNDTQTLWGTVDIKTGPVLVTGSLNAPSITGSLFGTASWANNAITASYALTASNALNAQDILIYVKNVTGTQINKGTVVRISGATGDNALISTASYENDNNSANTLGITNENIANDSFGYVMTEGKLIGIDTSTFTAGQLLYLGPTGSIIGTAPVAPLHNVRLGQVLRVQLNNGSMYVRIDNGYELGELHDVVDTTTTSSYGDLLVKSGSVWTNSRQLTGSYGLTGSFVGGSFSGSFSGSLIGSASYATNAGNANAIDIYSFGSNVESYLLMSNVIATTGVAVGGDSDLRYNASTNRLTVGSISATSLTGSLLGTASFASSGTGTFSGSFSGSFQGNGSGLTNISASAIVGLNLSQIATGSVSASVSPNAASFQITSGSTNFLYVSSSGNIGIGTTTPTSAKLQISGSTSALGIQGSGSGVFTVDGTSGRLFSVDDSLSGSLFSVNTAAGLPLIEAFSDNTVRIGQFGQRALFVSQSKVGIGKESALNGILDVSGSVTVTGSVIATSFTGSLLGTASLATSASFASTASFVNPLNQNVVITGSLTVITGSAIELQVTNTGVKIGNASTDVNTVTGSLQVAGQTRISGSFNTAVSGTILTVVGSGSTQPIFTVQGSQGELFSVTDSLTGSLFSVNDISGLPILEVFSDSTTNIGNYLAPAVYTTNKITQTNSGSFVVYSLPTASYDGAFYDYTVRSGSNARAGQIMAIWSGSSVNFTETTTTSFGSTSAINFTVIVSGSNMVLTGSSATGSWTIKTIIRSI